MKQSQASPTLSKGREAERILTGVPIIPSKQTLEIPGAHAALRISTAEPEFFMRPADEREPRFRLLRAQVKGGQRVLENISIHIYGRTNPPGDGHRISNLDSGPRRLPLHRQPAPRTRRIRVRRNDQMKASTDTSGISESMRQDKTRSNRQCSPHSRFECHHRRKEVAHHLGRSKSIRMNLESV